MCLIHLTDAQQQRMEPCMSAIGNTFASARAHTHTPIFPLIKLFTRPLAPTCSPINQASKVVPQGAANMASGAALVGRCWSWCRTRWRCATSCRSSRCQHRRGRGQCHVALPLWVCRPPQLPWFMLTRVQCTCACLIATPSKIKVLLLIMFALSYAWYLYLVTWSELFGLGH